MRIYKHTEIMIAQYLATYLYATLTTSYVSISTADQKELIVHRVNTLFPTRWYLHNIHLHLHIKETMTGHGWLLGVGIEHDPLRVVVVTVVAVVVE